MIGKKKRSMPRWVYIILSIGTAWASGIYLGIIRTEGASCPDIIRIIGFGVFAILMAGGALAKRNYV
jgi:hypothetical protein